MKTMISWCRFECRIKKYIVTILLYIHLETLEGRWIIIFLKGLNNELPEVFPFEFNWKIMRKLVSFTG